MTRRRLLLIALLCLGFTAGLAYGLTEEYAACRYEGSL